MLTVMKFFATFSGLEADEGFWKVFNKEFSGKYENGKVIEEIESLCS